MFSNVPQRVAHKSAGPKRPATHIVCTKEDNCWRIHLCSRLNARRHNRQNFAEKAQVDNARVDREVFCEDPCAFRWNNKCHICLSFSSMFLYAKGPRGTENGYSPHGHHFDGGSLFHHGTEHPFIHRREYIVLQHTNTVPYPENPFAATPAEIPVGWGTVLGAAVGTGLEEGTTRSIPKFCLIGSNDAPPPPLVQTKIKFQKVASRCLDNGNVLRVP